MNENQKNIDRLIQDKLFNYAINPPEIVWKKIEGDLKQEKNRIIIPFYLKIAGVLILFTGLGGVIWKLTDKSSPRVINTTTAFQNVITPSIKDNRLANESEKSIITNVNPKNEVVLIRKAVPTNFQTHKISDNHRLMNFKESSVNSDTSNNTENHLLSSVDQMSPADLTIANRESQSRSVKLDTVVLTSNKTETDSSANSVKTSKPPVKILDVFLAEDAPKNTKSPKWSVGGQAGPQYSYRDVNSDKLTTSHYNKVESPVMAYAGGINIQLEAARLWAVQSGIYYSKIGTERTLDNAGGTKVTDPVQNWGNSYNMTNQGNASDVYMNSTGEITISYKKQEALGINAIAATASDSPDEYHVDQYCEYLEIPLILRYRLLANKLKINLLGGISSNILVGNSIHETGPNNFDITAHIEAVNKTNFNGSLGFGIEYPISGNILFNIEPVFKYYFSSVSGNQDVDVHPYSIGLMTGISCKF